MASPVGGTSIEDVAASNPEKIFKEPIDIMEGAFRGGRGWTGGVMIGPIDCVGWTDLLHIGQG